MKPANRPALSLWRILGLALCLTSAWSCFYLKYVAAVLLAVGVVVLARRAYDWCRTRPADCPVASCLVALAAGAPFLLLLAVAGLIR